MNAVEIVLKAREAGLRLYVDEKNELLCRGRVDALHVLLPMTLVQRAEVVDAVRSCEQPEWYLVEWWRRIRKSSKLSREDVMSYLDQLHDSVQAKIYIRNKAAGISYEMADQLAWRRIGSKLEPWFYAEHDRPTKIIEGKRVKAPLPDFQTLVNGLQCATECAHTRLYVSRDCLIVNGPTEVIDPHLISSIHAHEARLRDEGALQLSNYDDKTAGWWGERTVVISLEKGITYCDGMSLSEVAEYVRGEEAASSSGRKSQNWGGPHDVEPTHTPTISKEGFGFDFDEGGRDEFGHSTNGK